MEPSILISTKQILGLDDSVDEFDLDILTHINAAFSVLNQIGVGPAEFITVESDEVLWSDLELPVEQLSVVRSYIFLKVQMLWDPATSGFLIDARNKQIAEYEWRLNTMREEALYNAGN